ncbi:MAG: septum formation protein Maf [Candidatus Latescibacteria bacterium]|nr:septum formation protein Maf [Candidatus Latescibacterota bacterium]
MSAHENPLLVLGSGSPRRAALMQQIGLPFVQWHSAAAEPAPREGAPADHALETARLKARAVQQALYSHYGPDRATIVIGADTVVHFDGAVLGKPADQAEAARMLRLLAGRTHQVYTGVALLCSDGRQWEDCAQTQVRMRPLSTAQIDRYLASGEAADKAGAYGIQGGGALLIERIEGCYYNVVGLPLALLSTLLEKAGYDFSTSP